jgi:hypothetical protein
MGETISLVAKLGQILSKNGLAVIQSIVSETVSREERKDINPKLVIALGKSEDFDKLTADIQIKS